MITDRQVGLSSANQAVEATAPRRLTFVRHHFHHVLVSGGRALPGAVPHLGRSAFCLHAP
jgi:hypothetical protein